jgi:hypothetical protein
MSLTFISLIVASFVVAGVSWRIHQQRLRAIADISDERFGKTDPHTKAHDTGRP